MKKYLLFLMLIPFLGFISCSDDHDDLPDVDFNIQMEGATKIDGTLYVVQGETVDITSIVVVNKEADRSAMITAANFYWDYYFLGTAVQPPFAYSITTTDATPVGKHVLEIECPVYATDKSPATALLSFDVEVVADAADIPAEGHMTGFSTTPSITPASSK